MSTLLLFRQQLNSTSISTRGMMPSSKVWLLRILTIWDGKRISKESLVTCHFSQLSILVGENLCNRSIPSFPKKSWRIAMMISGVAPNIVNMVLLIECSAVYSVYYAMLYIRFMLIKFHFPNSVPGLQIRFFRSFGEHPFFRVEIILY